MTARFLLDTHIVIRWLSDSGRLSREQMRILREAVRRGEPLAVSALTLLEISVMSGLPRSRREVPVRKLLAELESYPIFRFYTVDFDIAAEVASMGDFFRDPADRAIVATARVMKLRLLTSDQRIIDSKLVPIVD